MASHGQLCLQACLGSRSPSHAGHADTLRLSPSTFEKSWVVENPEGITEGFPEIQDPFPKTNFTRKNAGENHFVLAKVAFA